MTESQQKRDKKKRIYPPFDAAIFTSSTSEGLEGPAIAAPTSPPCTRCAFSCSAVWTRLMLEANRVTMLMTTQKKGTGPLVSSW